MATKICIYLWDLSRAFGRALIIRVFLQFGAYTRALERKVNTPLGMEVSPRHSVNYRPISLTSIVCKILEHIIHTSVISHFEKNKILTDFQHGFRKRRSCETQLILKINDLSRGLNNKQQIDAILLDFSKFKPLTVCPTKGYYFS